jgi:hypothetical protein
VHVFLELALILTGIGLISMGAYWGGMTNSRSSWVAIGIPALALAGITVFSAAGEKSLPEWAFAGTSAGIVGLAAAVVGWGIISDRTLGLYGLIYAAAAGLTTGGIGHAGGFHLHALGTLLAACAGGVIFLAALVVPGTVFRHVAGWGLVVLGLGIGFLGYADSISVWRP